MISIVNGYVCTNCADAAKAKHGIDPHPSPAKEAQDAAKASKAGGLEKPSRVNDPAVVFGGVLSSVAAADKIAPPTSVPQAPISAQPNAQKVDVFA